jgi:DDE family transposase
MTDNSLLPFSLPSVERKKVTAAFDGGRLSSNGGAMLLALAERRIGIADRLAAEIVDRRDPARVVHTLSDILRARILAIACGYEDADDLDYLRNDPALTQQSVIKTTFLLYSGAPAGMTAACDATGAASIIGRWKPFV